MDHYPLLNHDMPDQSTIVFDYMILQKQYAECTLEHVPEAPVLDRRLELFGVVGEERGHLLQRGLLALVGKVDVLERRKRGSSLAWYR